MNLGTAQLGDRNIYQLKSMGVVNNFLLAGLYMHDNYVRGHR